jgi:predicted Zn-dependent peptidase
MLQEGSKKRDSKSIADYIDFRGAYVQFDVNADYATVSLFCLSKHLTEMIPFVSDLILNPGFPKKELKTLCNKEKQNLTVNLEKVAFKARRHFFNAIFGSAHPYGSIIEPEDYLMAADKVEILAAFHENHYLNRPLAIIISGNQTQKAAESIDKHFCTYSRSERAPSPIFPPVETSAEKRIHIPQKNTVQTGLRMGYRSIGKTHADYIPLKILITIFGGYFGSRLMSNIREDKGYTYGIGASLTAFRGDSLLTIGTETGSEYCEPTINEVIHEMEVLRNELISTEELSRVQDYLAGVILNDFDGPFAIADRMKDVLLYEQSLDYYQQFFKTIKTIEATQLRALANQYLKPEELSIVTVG